MKRIEPPTGAGCAVACVIMETKNATMELRLR
jgi:hypothetical protein